MADLIKPEDMTELKSASALEAVASHAVYIHEKQAVAHALNTAANSGQHSITWSKGLSEALQVELRAQGYKLIKNNHAADLTRVWTIGGF